MDKKKIRLIIELVMLLVIIVLGVSLVMVNNGKTNDKDVKLLELSQLEDYKNYDGTYGSMKQLLFKNEENGMVYTISLSMDGKVYTGNYSSRKYLNGMEGAVDIVSYSDGPGGIDVMKCYILLNNGKVYLYNVSDLLKNKYNAVLVDDVTNVDRIFEFQYGPMENAGGLWGVMAVTRDGKYIELAKSGV